MFWRRKKTETVDTVYSVQSYAAQLGIERRRNTRILYPNQNLSSLPSFFFGGRSLAVHDLSAGGVCLLDKDDHLGPDAGNEIELRLIWPDCERVVRCRLVSCVDVRRHIQFLDLEGERSEAIKRAIVPGVLGQTMKPLMMARENPVQLKAREIWSSTKGDTITFVEDAQMLAEIVLDSRIFRVAKDGWPTTEDGQPASLRDLEAIVLFLINFPKPSPAIQFLRTQIQTLYFEGHA